MKFTCQSGKHKESVEATNFESAGRKFLELLLERQGTLKVGEIIQVTCEVTESFFATSDILKEMSAEFQPMKLAVN